MWCLLIIVDGTWFCFHSFKAALGQKSN